MQNLCECFYEKPQKIDLILNPGYFAEIEKDVLILGMNKYIEVWNPQLYEEYLQSIEDSYEEIAKEVMDM